ncbi:glutaminyl-peptide cyclotransferase [Robiginitalea sp. SC105]|uniref:glutaminyl-peptide cyclotransferase n=1 Tax=Robiginitalea sp. SC105 TaxID=2762332 RepID=UPI0021026F07|nr:glutaminyl-peptide cyclotransferase [Robiginitalea sp. SC105]
MTYWKISLSGLLLGLFLGCGGNDPSRDFAIELGEGGKKFTHNQEVSIGLRNTSGLEVDSVRYFLDGSPLALQDGRAVLASRTLGEKSLEARIHAGGTLIRVEKDFDLLAEKAPEIYTYEILNTYPHDQEAFTQGLEFRGDTLYESTGQRGYSSLRKVDYRSGEILAQTDLSDNYFGEGISLLGDTLYMLTWQSKTGFLFDPDTLEKLGNFAYGESKEGWGLCNDGQVLYKSDGSQRIWKLDPRTLREIGHIETVTDKSVFNKANELEFVNGKIYANVWQKPSMMIIDAASGAIEGVVNFGGLEKKVTQHDRLDVFNGVAYHAGRGSFFVTGKRWDKLFEVRIVKREP